jgi:hypothetical protein
LFSLKLAPEKPQQLLSAVGFWTGLGAKSYTMMGSFVQHILTSYGIDKFKQVYSDANFETVYGKEPNELISQWESSVQRVAVTAELENATRFIFDRKSIVEAECPHMVAQRLHQASREFNNGNFHAAEQLYREVLQMTGGKEPAAAYGYIQARLVAASDRRQSFDTVFTEVESLAARLEKPGPALLTIASARLWMGYGPADSAARRLGDVYQRHLSFTYDLAAQLRLAMIREGLQMNVLSPKLSREDRLKIVRAQLDTARIESQKKVLNLYMAELLAMRWQYAEALTHLDMQEPFAQPELELERQMLRLKGFLVLGRFEDARKAAVEAKTVSRQTVGTVAKHHYIDALLKLYRVKPQNELNS